MNYTESQERTINNIMHWFQYEMAEHHGGNIGGWLDDEFWAVINSNLECYDYVDFKQTITVAELKLYASEAIDRLK